MARNAISGLIQCHNPINDESVPVKGIQRAALEYHLSFIEEAGKKGVQILCLQEIFNGPLLLPLARRTLVRCGRARAGPPHA